MDSVEKLVSESDDFYDKERRTFVNLLDALRRAPEECLPNLFLSLGARLHALDHFKLALHVWNKALEHSIRRGNRRKEAESGFDIGIAFFALGRSDKGISCLS